MKYSIRYLNGGPDDDAINWALSFIINFKLGL